MKKLIFDPLEEYRDIFKHKHNENVNNLFDELVKKSQVDLGLNDLTIKEIKALDERIANENKFLKKRKTIRSLLIFLIVVLLIVSVFFIYSWVEKSELLPAALLISLSIALPVLAVVLIVVIVKTLNAKIKDAQSRLKELIDKRAAKENEAWNQVNNLNALFEAQMSPALVEKTIPLLTMDPLFDSRRFDYLARKYGLSDFTGENESAEFVQSGEIQGNPFLLARSLYMDMGTKSYAGSLTVSYSYTVYVDNKPQTKVRVETLTASVTKPCPYYSNDTIIIYGNEAAGNLSFNRYPQLPLDWTPKSLASFVKKEETEMRKLADKAIKKGKNFTPLGNTEFEALFNAYNRDNEVEYRLLFTALGQSEIVDLIKDKTVGFGDNFEFHKRQNINIIRSRHSQAFDYSADPKRYYHFDNKVIRERFTTYNNAYLRYFYFNIAPVLAVPLYQQHKPQEFIYQTEYKSHLSFYEHEATAHYFPSSSLAHPESVTQNILKTRVIAKGVDFDTVTITSHGFKTIERTDYIPRAAGNGVVYSVPVHWIEYIPVSKNTNATIKVLNEEEEKKVKDQSIFDRIGSHLSKYTNKNTPVTGRHVLAFLVAKNFSDSDSEELKKLF